MITVKYEKYLNDMNYKKDLSLQFEDLGELKKWFLDGLDKKYSLLIKFRGDVCRDITIHRLDEWLDWVKLVVIDDKVHYSGGLYCKKHLSEFFEKWFEENVANGELYTDFA